MFTSVNVHLSIYLRRGVIIGGMAVQQRVRNKRGQGDQLRDDLLAAAGELLDVTGEADGLSVRTITRQAGVSHTALYLHFSDVDQLVRAVKARCFEALGAALGAARDAAGGDPAEQLRAMARAYLQYAREHPGHYALLYHVTKTAPSPHTPAPEVLEAGMATLSLLPITVASCLNRNADDDTVHDIAYAIWLGLHGRATIQRAMPWMPLPDEERHISLLIDSVRRQQPTPNNNPIGG